MDEYSCREEAFGLSVFFVPQILSKHPADIISGEKKQQTVFFSSLVVLSLHKNKGNETYQEQSAAYISAAK